MTDYKKYIVFIKIISITALFATILLWLILWGFSFMDGDTSKAFTNWLTNAADDAFSVTDKIEEGLITQQVKFTDDLQGFYFIDQTVEPNLQFFPASTKDKDVEFLIDDQSVAKVYDNKITFLSQGTANLTVRLKSNPQISDKILLWCVGDNIFENKSKQTLTLNATDIQTSNHYEILLNSGNTAATAATYSVSDESIGGVFEGVFYARSQGLVTITANISQGDNVISIDHQITVISGDKSPVSSLNLPQNLTITEDETIGDYRTLFECEDGRHITDYYCSVQSSDTNVLEIKGVALVAKKAGDVTLTFTSAYNIDVKAALNVKVNYISPKSLTIIGSDWVMMNGEDRYTASHSPKEYDDKVVFSVVSGKATISEDGTLTATSLGKVTIRCQSIIDQNLIAEKTIKVKLFTNAYMFVRKIMGHGGTSVILGFGVMGTMFLLLKRKRFAAFCPAVTFIYAGVSELIQYFVPGRFATIIDVFIDFSGTLLGIVLALITIGLLFLVWRIFSKKSFEKLLHTLKYVNYKTLFVKTESLNLMMQSDYIVKKAA